MPDKEKVIKGLERCSKHDGSECPNCPYFNGECTDDLMADALALLKEQETEIRQLSLALDIVKGACEGIRVEGGEVEWA